MKKLHSTLNILTPEPALGASIMVELRITNQGDEYLELRTFEVSSLPPDYPWEHSINAYNISVLQSIGMLAIHLASEEGARVASAGLAPWVTPVLMSRAIAPGEAFSFQFDINELFKIASPGCYLVRARYSDQGLNADAASKVAIKANGGRR